MKVTVSGREVLIDDEDEPLFRSRTWHVSKAGYLIYTNKIPTLLFHRALFDHIPQGMEVDHINRNKLDNRRDNLRIVTRSSNRRNVPARPGKTSKYRGVSWNNGAKKWQVVLRVNGRMKWIGAYESEDDAGAVAAPHFDGIAT